jgi:hypothetical protein
VLDRQRLSADQRSIGLLHLHRLQPTTAAALLVLDRGQYVHVTHCSKFWLYIPTTCKAGQVQSIRVSSRRNMPDHSVRKDRHGFRHRLSGPYHRAALVRSLHVHLVRTRYSGVQCDSASFIKCNVRSGPKATIPFRSKRVKHSLQSTERKLHRKPPNYVASFNQCQRTQATTLLRR